MRYRGSIATFRGKHNLIKTKCLLALETRNKSVTLRELANATSCDYRSLSVLVGRWTTWHYILRYGEQGH